MKWQKSIYICPAERNRPRIYQGGVCVCVCGGGGGGGGGGGVCPHTSLGA